MQVNDYTGRLHLSKGTVRHRNPRHFTEPKPCDYVKSDHQHIIDAYAAVGIPEYKDVDNAESETRQLPDDSGPQSVSEPSSVKHTSNVEQVNYGEVQEKEEQVIPDNFSELSFFEQRAIAQKLTDEKVINKEDVQRVIAQHQ